MALTAAINLAAVGSTFSPPTTVHGQELWKSDGTFA
jgi:hypothetical protein